jgi:protein phosphatase
MNGTNGVIPIRIAAQTHKGRRENNEDSIYGATFREGKIRGLVAVADGMGGHNAGEVASSIAVDTLLSSMKRRLKAGSGRLETKNLVQQIVNEIDEAVKKAAGDSEDRRGMGTTLCFGVITDRGFFVGSIGDSRAYFIRGDQVLQVSMDHTAYFEMIRSGRVTPEEAAKNPRAHYVTRSICGKTSTTADVFPPQGGLFEYQDGDVLLLCSDGLINTVRDDEIVDQLQGTGNLSLACHNLVSLAYLKGGTDNISLVAVEFGAYQRSPQQIESLPSVDFISAATSSRRQTQAVKAKRLKLEIVMLLMVLLYILFVFGVIFLPWGK